MKRKTIATNGKLDEHRYTPRTMVVRCWGQQPAVTPNRKLTSTKEAEKRCKQMTQFDKFFY